MRDVFLVSQLILATLVYRVDTGSLSEFSSMLKSNHAIGFSEESKVPAKSDIAPWLNLSCPLSHEYGAGIHRLPIPALYS